MAKKRLVATNSEYGLYNNTNPSYNLYVGTQSRLSKSAKSMRVPKYSADGINKMLNACGGDFQKTPIYLNADAETQEVMDDDEGQIFPLVDENGKNIELVEGEPIFCIKNGRAIGYESNSGSSKSESYITTEKDVFGYVKGTNKNNYTGNFFKVSNAEGRNAHKREWYYRNTPEFGVYRRIDENGNMTQEPVFINGNAIGRKRSLNVLLNVMSGGAYGATKLAYKIGRDIALLAFSKKERDAVNKEWSPKRKEYDKNIEELSKIFNEIEGKEITLAGQASNPKDNVVTNASVWNNTMKDFVSSKINTIISYYTAGVKLKNYLDSKCKVSPYVNADYTNILENLYALSSYKFRNEKPNGGFEQWVNDSAKKIYGSSNDFGFTKSIWDNAPTNSHAIYAVAVAYWLQSLGEKGFEKYTDENAENFFKNEIKVCSYAFWGLYLSHLKTWANATDRTQQNTAFIRKDMVDVLVSKGYSTNSLVSITKGNGETAEKFYKNQMLENRWVNALSTFEQYPYFDSDYTLLQIEELYNECVKINNRNKTLLTEIQKLCDKYKVVKDFNKEADNRILFKKSIQNFADIFNSASNRNKAIKRARELKRELLPRCKEHASLEVEMDKIEANMKKTRQDIETYQRILDDTSNDETARNNADSMLDKLSNDMDKFIEKQENALMDAEDYDAKEIKPREEEFTKLGEIVSKVGDIFASYKRKSARQEFRIKKKEMKDELKSLYGKGWRKKGDWKSVKIEYKVERNQILEEYQSVFGKIAHGTLAFLLMPARNICTIILMLNIGGMTTRLEQMKLVHDSNDKTSDAIKIRNAYELVLQRWYSIGGKKEFLENIITKYGKAKPIANKSSEPDKILEENGYDIEHIASKDTELKLDAEGKKYYNFVVSEYIATIVGYVKSFVGWLCTALKGWLGYLITALKAIGNLFGRNKDEENYMSDDDSTIGNGIDDEPALNSASQIALLEAYIAQGVKPILTEEQKQSITDLICDKGYTFLQAFEEVTGMVLSIDENGNFKNETRSSRIWAGVGLGVGLLAVGGILWAIFSDNK